MRGRGIDHGETVPSPSIATRACRSDDQPPATARRFLALRHFLAPPRSLPAGREGLAGRGRLDPVRSPRGGGRNHDLVLLARVPGYRRELTDALLYEERVLYETYNKASASSRPPTCPGSGSRGSQSRREGERRLHRARRARRRAPRPHLADGHLSSTDMAPRGAIDWYWRPTNQVRAILEALAQSGILGIARREGNRRIYDLVERLFPADLLAERPGSSSSAASSSCRATAPTDSSGPEGRPRSGWGRAPAVPSVVSGARS